MVTLFFYSVCSIFPSSIAFLLVNERQAFDYAIPYGT